MANTSPAHNRVTVPKGQRYGRLTVVEEVDCPPPRKFICRCDCGEVTKVQLAHLRHNHTTSCGCKSRERSTKHGEFGTPIYWIWRGIIGRCTQPGCSGYENYGGRGIKVCERWAASFEAFVEDMGERPEGMTIERLDNEGDYEPSNCLWASRKQQARNTRANRLVTCNGETLCVTEWAERLGVPPTTLSERLRSGWSDEDTITKPVQQRRK